MGTPMAPSYANLFMGHLEDGLLRHAPHKPLQGSWKRFIDDINFIWTETSDSLDELFSFINNTHPTIKFTAESSNSQVPFLDVLVKLDQGNLTTQLFTKPTDTHQYLLP